MKNKYVYFDDINQKIRWTKSDPKDISVSYNYIGQSSKVEFDLLIELLWCKYQDSDISLIELKKIFDMLRNFCDLIKENYNMS